LSDEDEEAVLCDADVYRYFKSHKTAKKNTANRLAENFCKPIILIVFLLFFASSGNSASE
jgi:hypothetical protein